MLGSDTVASFQPPVSGYLFAMRHLHPFDGFKMDQPPPSNSLMSPIFLFSNWRTGGTALAFAFRKSPRFYVYTEPFNPTLRDPGLALNAQTTGWKSKHPSNQFYFTEYAPLLMSGDFFFPEVEKLPYVLGPNDRCDDLHSYLSQLITFAQSNGKAPVFKFEQLEGAAPWIAANFPDGLRIGVTRDPVHQLISWMEQASFGVHDFFMLAHRLIANNVQYFMTDNIAGPSPGDVAAYIKIFDIFRRRIDIQHRDHMHFCLDISPETTETIEAQLGKVAAHKPDQADDWKLVLQEVRDSLHREPDTAATLRRLSDLVTVKGECATLRVAIDEAQDLQARIRELEQRESELRTLRREVEERRAAIDLITASKKWKILSKIWGVFEWKKSGVLRKTL